jgi:hypothetical protein
MYYLARIVASLVLSFGSSAQEFAAEPAIASAAVVLKLALPTHASRLTILSADRAAVDPFNGHRDTHGQER